MWHRHSCLCFRKLQRLDMMTAYSRRYFSISAAFSIIA
jgi:hypothetical protein